MEQVRQFYSKIKFPGPYTIENLEFYDEILINYYLKEFDNAIKDCQTIIDIGCGSGFIVNFLARRYPNKEFTAIDFSDSIDYARNFSIQHDITNIEFYKEDFLQWETSSKYDLIICNGVLHHIPNYIKVLERIKQISNNKIIIGLYNPYGKMAKKVFKVSYVNDILYTDQEHCPFELTFDDNEVKMMFKEYRLVNVYPSFKNKFTDLLNILNYRNGGLTVYTWIKSE